jgi:hypothetical protein
LTNFVNIIQSIFKNKTVFFDNHVFLNKIAVAVAKSLWASRRASMDCCLGNPISTRRVMLASVGSGPNKNYN